ncbi:MAG: VanZ family protein [bacterium]
MSGLESKKRYSYWFAALGVLFFIYMTLGISRPVLNYLIERNLRGLVVFVLLGAFFACIVYSVIKYNLLTKRNWPFFAIIAVAYGVSLNKFTVQPEEKIHFVEYGILAFLLYRALKIDIKNKIILCISSLVLIFMFGLGDELIQKVLPNRYYDIRDVYLNFVSGALVISMMAFIVDVKRNQIAKNI